MINTIENFYKEFYADLLFEIDINQSSLAEEIFTRFFSTYLEEYNEIEGIQTCNHVNEIHKTKLNGFYINEDLTQINFYVAHFKKTPTLESGSLKELKDLIKLVQNFFEKSRTGISRDLEQSTEEYDISISILKNHKKITNIKIIVFSNLCFDDYIFEDSKSDDTEIEYVLWDMRKLYEVVQSDESSETIKVEFVDPLRCIEISNSLYTSYLVVLPAKVLAEIYDKYKLRILERNVRAFLQVKGKVNSGIKKTLSDEPDLFFAYNNGISAIASYVDTFDVNGQIFVKSIEGLQIVNGGQTTASIHHAFSEAKYDVSTVNVQMKLTQIDAEELEDEIVTNISRFANTQNSVQIADFSANSPYHKGIEKLSREIAAVNPDTRSQFKWFYERVRGQYIESRKKTVEKDKFDRSYPRDHIFTKLDLAKFEMAWEQRPDIVSKGQQYCFRTFTEEYVQPSGKAKTKVVLMPDEESYKKTIAKAIIFREAQKIIKSQKFAGYAANILAYTVSMISFYSGKKLDLYSIWENQKIDMNTELLICNLSHLVRDSFVKNARDENISQYCKKAICWKGMIDDSISWNLDNQINSLKLRLTTTPTNNGGNYNDILENIRIIDLTTPDFWFNMSKWGKESGKLNPWQKQFAFNIGVSMNRKSELTPKQIHFCIVLIKEAGKNGFSIPDLLVNRIDTLN